MKAASNCQSQLAEAHTHHAQRCQTIESKWKQTTESEKTKYEEARWEAMAVFDAAKHHPPRHLQEANKQIEDHRNRIDGLPIDFKIKRGEAIFHVGQQPSLCIGNT